jgi:hypothetical protein
MRLPLHGAVRALAVGALAALSLPGVRAARAEADLVPPAKQLFAFDARTPAPRAPAAPTSCGAQQVASLRAAQAGREAALARIAEAVAGRPGDEVEVLNGRGYGYPVGRDPSLELLRIQREAKALRAAR